MVFFTIPWIFVIALVVIALGIGASALQFILDHIVIISIIIWLPVAWVTWTMWKYYDDDDDEKVECVLYPLFLVPAYAAIIQIIGKRLVRILFDVFYRAARSNNSSRGMHGNCMGVGVAL